MRYKNGTNLRPNAGKAERDVSSDNDPAAAEADVEGEGWKPTRKDPDIVHRRSDP
jgi:hypothetical protein